MVWRQDDGQVLALRQGDRITFGGAVPREEEPYPAVAGAARGHRGHGTMGAIGHRHPELEVVVPDEVAGLHRPRVVVLACGRGQDALMPSAAFIDAGTTGRTHEVSAGLMWDWNRRSMTMTGGWGGYWEATISEWSYPDSSGRRNATLAQFGATPVFRYRFNGGPSSWFAEVGIGATLTSALYETDQKRFSTRFNFGDHLGLGRNFGEGGRHEVALRVEHFSNGGYKNPNPGENFVQIRYACNFR